MIEIVTGNNEVEIDGEMFHPFNDRDSMLALVVKILDIAMYSGETIRVNKETLDGAHKTFINEWYSNPRS